MATSKTFTLDQINKNTPAKSSREISQEISQIEAQLEAAYEARRFAKAWEDEKAFLQALDGMLKKIDSLDLENLDFDEAVKALGIRGYGLGGSLGPTGKNRYVHGNEYQASKKERNLPDRGAYHTYSYIYPSYGLKIESGTRKISASIPVPGGLFREEAFSDTVVLKKVLEKFYKSAFKRIQNASPDLRP